MPVPTNQPSRCLSNESLRSVPPNMKDRSASVETWVHPADTNKSVLGLDRTPSLPPIDHACPFSCDRRTSEKPPKSANLVWSPLLPKSKSTKAPATQRGLN